MKISTKDSVMVICSFCGKTQREVSKLVKSDKGTAICDECLVVSFAKMIGSPVKFVGESSPEPDPLPTQD